MVIVRAVREAMIRERSSASAFRATAGFGPRCSGSTGWDNTACGRIDPQDLHDAANVVDHHPRIAAVTGVTALGAHSG